ARRVDSGARALLEQRLVQVLRRNPHLAAERDALVGGEAVTSSALAGLQFGCAADHPLQRLAGEARRQPFVNGTPLPAWPAPARPRRGAPGSPTLRLAAPSARLRAFPACARPGRCA